MKKVILVFLIFVNLISCKSLIEKENISTRIYLYHLGVVENSALTGYLDKDDSLNRSINFLEELTNIKCDVVEQYVSFYEPSKKNLLDWKRWFKKNKEYLYWDEENQKMKINK